MDKRWQSVKSLLDSMVLIGSRLEAEAYSVQLLVRELESVVTSIKTMTSPSLGPQCYNRQEEGL